MSSCMSCDAIGLSKKREITDVVNKIFANGVSEIINEYVGKCINLFVLHSTDNTYVTEHIICDNCFQKMSDIAVLCDTNISTCPLCPRHIYMP